MTSQPRNTMHLKHNWKFTLGDALNAHMSGFDDSAWQSVSIPHDWAIGGQFHRDNDVQFTRVVEDGETSSSEHNGRTGGLPHVGVGWYRLKFEVTEPETRRQAWLCFDGVMSNSTVYLNGIKVGERAFGYASFNLDVSETLRFNGENTLAVRVNNMPRSSRWYPGAGIYRNVRLVLMNRTHIKPWGVFVTTPGVDAAEALVNVRTEISNRPMTDIVLRTSILDPTGREVAGNEIDLGVEDLPRATKNRLPVAEQELLVAAPKLWSLEEPALYKVRSELKTRDGTILDVTCTRFGIREIRIDADGLKLNGEHIKFKGVCMHHDLGALGAAVSRAAQARQIRLLQGMGCNAIRTAHNPPDPGYLELCDEMGMLVLDEAFDEWRVGKVENGYHVHFDKWSEIDLREFIRRDRNHPCVVMWSIGNEVGDQWIGQGRLTARRLVSICHEEDPTRPVTVGLNGPQFGMANKVIDELDVFGANYQPANYEMFREHYPDMPIFGSETASCVSTRGFYDFPEQPMEGKYIHRDSLQVSSFDLESPPWAWIPDIEFDAVDRCAYVMGEFVWTGFDYLGEPTPYNSEWPARSSYFGIIDLCGIPKDRYYLYKSRWSDEPVLHLMPHWNWPGREGRKTRVQCYTSYDQVELFLNGVSQGVRQKDKKDLHKRYRLAWEDVLYEPGELKAVALSGNGKTLAETVVKTAGAPTALKLIPEADRIKADGEDLVYVRVQMQDADGILCPLARDRIVFSVQGPADIVAVDNGDQQSLEPFQARERLLFYGQAMAILRSRGSETGMITLQAETEKIAGSAVCEIEAVK